MGEVAGILIGDGHLNPAPRGDRAERRQELAGISYQLGEALRFGGVGGIVAQQVAILLHRCAAAGGIDDDRFRPAVEEGVDIAAGHGLRHPGLSVVDVERAAASLGFGNQDIAAVASQYPHGCLVDVGKEETHHASSQHRHARAPFAACRKWLILRGEEAVRHRRQHRRHFIEPGRQEGAAHALQSASLIEP